MACFSMFLPWNNFMVWQRKVLVHLVDKSRPEACDSFVHIAQIQRAHHMTAWCPTRPRALQHSPMKLSWVCGAEWALEKLKNIKEYLCSLQAKPLYWVCAAARQRSCKHMFNYVVVLRAQQIPTTTLPCLPALYILVHHSLSLFHMSTT
jgi:hypothetical protein